MSPYWLLWLDITFGSFSQIIWIPTCMPEEVLLCQRMSPILSLADMFLNVPGMGSSSDSNCSDWTSKREGWMRQWGKGGDHKKGVQTAEGMDGWQKREAAMTLCRVFAVKDVCNSAKKAVSKVTIWKSEDHHKYDTNGVWIEQLDSDTSSSQTWCTGMQQLGSARRRNLL